MMGQICGRKAAESAAAAVLWLLHGRVNKITSP